MTITPKHVYKLLFFKTLKTQNKTIMSTHTINFRNDNVLRIADVANLEAQMFNLK
jgi:hypothetical protein